MEIENKPIENPYLDENNKFKEGNPGGGRPKESDETKAIRKARKQLIEEYKEALAEYLPNVKPVFMAKVLEGDMPAIKEYHDRVLDKARQVTDITTDGKELPIPILNVQFNNSDKENPGAQEEN